MLFCGIDLHSNNCLVVVSDDNDKVVYAFLIVVVVVVIEVWGIKDALSAQCLKEWLDGLGPYGTEATQRRRHGLIVSHTQGTGRLPSFGPRHAGAGALRCGPTGSRDQSRSRQTGGNRSHRT